MPILHLMRGLPGSGKTTLARKLERELPALRPTPDEWMARIVGTGYDETERAAVEAVQWEIAARALELGIDVILENGFWSRGGATTKLHFLDVARDELLRRLALRNAALPADTFRVSEVDLDLWSKKFDPPAADELELWTKELGMIILVMLPVSFIYSFYALSGQRQAACSGELMCDED